MCNLSKARSCAGSTAKVIESVNAQEALEIVRDGVAQMREYAKQNEILLWTLAIGGTHRKKRCYALTVYASAIFLLLLFQCNGSRKELAGRLSYKNACSIGQWLCCVPSDPIEAVETREETRR